ncbi:MAG: hypothetical protein PHN38_09125 [Sulfurospirillaceae bacterium]|nr:hypothetical protein [Sulfurospirillaceae bacterium]
MKKYEILKKSSLFLLAHYKLKSLKFRPDPFSLFLLICILTANLYADRIITSVTVNGSSQTTVVANSNVSVAVGVRTTGGGVNDNWRSTRWELSNGSWSCVNHTNYNSSGNHSVNFNIVAPSTLGDYDLIIRAYSDDGCSQGGSGTSTLNDAIRVTTLNSFSGTNYRNFSLLYGTNIRGDIKIFGNTILGERQCLNWQLQWSWISGWTQVCTSYSDNAVCPSADSNNAEIQTRFWDVDEDLSTFNSSSSHLNIPNGSTIKKAYLYWQGLALSNEFNSALTIKLKSPNSDYVMLQASSSNINWSRYENYYPYQATIDITENMNGSGEYTIANLTTTEGQVTGLGTYGAWSIVVVYEDTDSAMKNISIYDGYQSVDDTNEQEITLSGFMTPTIGVVKSKFLVFAGEGDVDISGDYVEMDGVRLRRDDADGGNNAFNASVTEDGVSVTTRNPLCQNNLGIDIHTYDVGTEGQSIIGNSQTNTTIKLGSNQDMYFPSVFAFSTEMYVPDMCYEENITKNGSSLTDIFVGDVLDFEVFIANMSEQPAKSVTIKRVFSDNLNYERNSTYIKNSLGVFDFKTDLAGDDTASYAEESETLALNLGTGATVLSGGTFSKDQNETFRYKFNVQQDGNLTNSYTVSYLDDSNISGTGSISYANIPIGKCSDRAITSSVVPVLPSGKVRIVESGKNWNDYGGRLFTKIVSKPTQYDILFATNEDGSTLTTGVIKKLEILNIENQSSPILVATPINTATTIVRRYTINLTHLGAYKRLQFRITLEDDSLATSNDFSVRPLDFAGSVDNLWAGESVTIVPGNIIARDNVFNASAGYNTTLSTSNISKLNIDPTKTCDANTTAALIDTFSASLINGQGGSITAFFKDIANDLPVTILDSAWVSSSDDIVNSDCIVGSSSNMADGIGRFGCNIEGNVSVTIKPYELNVTTATFTASTGSSWLYDANVSDMYVTAKATVQANNKQHVALKNFTSTCYASPVDLTFYYDLNNTNGDVNLSYANIGGNMTSSLKPISDINKTITLPTSLFTTSSATAEYRLNVDRAYNIPLNPINIALRDVKVTSTAVAKDENNATLNTPLTFYYGRARTEDIKTNQTIAPHAFYVDVYCSNSCQSVNGFQQDTLHWYRNQNDSLTPFVDANISDKTGFAYDGSNPALSVSGTTMSTQGKVAFTLNNTINPIKSATVHVSIPTYLWYSRYKPYLMVLNASDCSNHPCFEYNYVANNINKAVTSGTMQGTTIGRDYNSTYKKTGVKLFR